MSKQIYYYESKLKYEMDACDLREALSRNENIILLDVRSPERYAKEHIPGSLNLHHITMTLRSTEKLNRSALYVTYSDGVGCNASTKGALNMARLGFRVKELIGGLDWWKREGHETEGSEGQKACGPGCGC